jgi:glycosyltransferase involved in cell wall biosynthesis
MSSTTVAIIVPVWNEEKYLPRLLDSIQRQTTAPDQVLVIDARSRDHTQSIAESYEFVTYCVSPELGTCEQRNYGAQQSSCDLYLFCDADSILPANCISVIKQRDRSIATFPIYAPAEPDLFVSVLFALQTIYF